VVREAEESIAQLHTKLNMANFGGAMAMELEAEPPMDRLVIPGSRDQVRPSFCCCCCFCCCCWRSRRFHCCFVFSFVNRLVTDPDFDHSERS